MNPKIKWFIDGYYQAMLFGLSTTMLIAFAVAYFHPDKAVTMYINKMHEANFEAVLIALWLPIAVYKVIKNE